MRALTVTSPVFVTDIYDPGFYERERALAIEIPTVAFDMDQTVASERDDPDFLLRPGIVDVLEKLRLQRIRTALWSGAKKVKVERLFQSHPELNPLFNVAITKEAYVKSAETYVGADPCAGLFAKEIGFLNYALLVDDNPDTQEFGHTAALHGRFETILVKKFFPYRMRPGEIWENDSIEILRRITEILTRSPFAIH